MYIIVNLDGMHFQERLPDALLYLSAEWEDSAMVWFNPETKKWTVTTLTRKVEII